MPSAKGSSLARVKALNQLQIRRSLYYNAPLTRQQMADELGVSLPTVTTNVARMLADGLLTEYGGQDASPQGGRKPQLVDFRADARFAAGLEFGPCGTRACITDLRGHVRCRREFGPAPKSYDKMLEQTARQIPLLIEDARIPAGQLLGLGVGIPGFVDSRCGTVRTGLYASWAGHALAEDLHRKAGLPVWADNNVRMRSLWREMFSGRNVPTPFVYLFVAKGIAAPLMVKSDIVAGKRASAGELGHTIAVPGGPVCPTCGRRGCLEAVASEAAVVRQVQQALGRKNYPTIRRVLEAQSWGEPTVQRIVAQAVEYLGVSVANIFNFISPSLVCIDGLLFTLEENRRRLTTVVRENLFGLSADEAGIEFLPPDPYTGAYGGAACAVRHSLLG